MTHSSGYALPYMNWQAYLDCLLCSIEHARIHLLPVGASVLQPHLYHINWHGSCSQEERGERANTQTTTVRLQQRT